METTSDQTIYRPIPIYGVSPVGMTPQGMARFIVLIGGDEPSAFKPYCDPKVSPTEYFIALVAASNNIIYGFLPVGRTQGMASTIVMIGGDGPSAFKPYCAPEKRRAIVGWLGFKQDVISNVQTYRYVWRPLLVMSLRLPLLRKLVVFGHSSSKLRSSLFNPDLDVAIPQEVKSSADSANLFSTWFMKKQGVDRVASRVAWSRIVRERGEEWREWTTRAEELKNEHKKQLMCGYVKLAPTKNRKRKLEASVGSQQLSNKKCWNIPIFCSHEP